MIPSETQRKNWKILIPLVIVVLLLGAAIFLFPFKKQVTKTPDQNQNQQPQTDNRVEAINGTKVDPAQVRRPFVVMIENHPDARPQSGLSQADMVYEALAEGGITRFMAVFQTQNVENLGPIRSARGYYIDWAQELGAIYVHVGGESGALNRLQAGVDGLANADQYFNDPYFHRITSRPAPHNVYTSVEQLLALASHQEFSLDKTYGAWKFKDDAPVATPAANTIAITFSLPSFDVKYTYDKASNSYLRFNAGVAAKDANNGEQLKPKVVIVQYVPKFQLYTDNPLDLGMKTRDGGAAKIFQDGNLQIASWKFVDGRTRFYDKENNEISFDRGQIWIEVVPPENLVKVTE